MSISDLKAQLKGGGARANLFEVELSFPSFAGGSKEIEAGMYLTKSAQLPSSELGTIEVPFQGRTFKLAGDRVFNEWTCSFLNDSDFTLKNAFERWSNAINEHESNKGLSNPEDYMVSLKVYQLDRQKKRIKEYEFRNAYPSTVGEIEVSMDSSDTIEEFSVTFQYTEWVSDTTS